MTDAIDQVRRAQGPAIAGELPADALEQGALTMFEDGDAVFTGNGVNSPADVCGRIIELEAQRFPELEAFKEAREAHIFAARNSLIQHNRHLKGQAPEQPVPAGEQFYTRGGDDLKKLLAPFKNNLGALRQMVADMGSGMGGKSDVTGHGVFSQGLGLPLIGEPEGSSAGAKKPEKI